MDPNAFAQIQSQAENMYKTRQSQRVAQPKQQKKKGPGGIEGFLINSLPAIGSGIGAIGGSFLAPVAGTVGGGAAGGAFGESLKRKILGEKQDIGQIVTQGLEGGALSGVGAGLKGIKSGAQALTKLGTGAAKETAPVAEKTGGSFLKNLTTQGQQAQGRVTGVSAGSKVAGRELTPQDTNKMLQTLKSEGVQTGNANNTFRDVQDKLKSYGQGISDHFKKNDAPLHPEDTKIIASNYLEGLKTTDPAVLKQAQIVADDLQKNVKSTKDLWEFRKTLDSRIPDTKFADEATTAKISALKNARQYITKELGDVPGAKNYHDLSEIKPFVSAESKRLNNPSGGIVGRVLGSGPVQKSESLLGKGVEKIGQTGSTNIPEDALRSASQATAELPQVATQAPGFLQKLVGAGANPIANPGKTAGSVLKQEAGRGFGLPAAITQANQATPQSTTEPNISQALLDTSSATPEDTNDPFSPDNVRANVQSILAQGGKQKDIADYLSNVKTYQDLIGPATTKPLNSTQQQQANNAQSGLDSLSEIAQTLQSNPGASKLASLPGGSLTSSLTGTGSYKAAVNNATDVIGRLRSGGAINQDEEKRFKSLLPGAFDDPETVNYKLTQLSTLFQRFVNPSGGSSDAADALSSLGL